jgi:hypothetical protein
MINHSDSNANKSLEPPLPYPGTTLDAERAQKPALPEPPYKPYAETALPEPPYEPYKGMQSYGVKVCRGERVNPFSVLPV